MQCILDIQEHISGRGGVRAVTSQFCETGRISDLFRSAFQSSNSISQFIIHDYMGIRAVALTTP